MILVKRLINLCQYYVVKKIYADHNDYKVVKNSINSLIHNLPNDFIGLNIGSGDTSIHANIKNIEISFAKNIDLVGSIERLPILDNKIDIIIAQEVLEHVKDPWGSVLEIERVLKKGGYIYLQLPFIIGYHPCPNDYWRFTHQGIEELLKKGNFEIVDLKITVGPASGFYRILVEFMSILFSIPIKKSYKIFKLFFALIFYPLKSLDVILLKSSQVNRISGGYFIIGKKK